MNEETPKFLSWAIVELFGHQRIAGLATEQTIAGSGFLRVDVPEVGEIQPFTRIFGPSAVYSIIPTSEEIARAYILANVSPPIHIYQPTFPVFDSSAPDFSIDEDLLDESI